jgi:hypothetical protein
MQPQLKSGEIRRNPKLKPAVIRSLKKRAAIRRASMQWKEA